MDACPNMVILKLRYLTFNFSNNHDQHQLSTTLFQPLNSLQHLYLDHCTFLNPQCYSFFSSCKFPHLKTLDAHMIWQPFININHPDTTVKYKHSIYHMITSFRLLSHLNLHYQLKKEDHYQMDSFHFNQLMLPNHELLEWLSANPKQLTFFGYDYDLLTTTNNYNYNNNNSNNIREPYLSYYYNNNPWQQSYLNHLTTLYFKNISTFLLNIETAATVLSTSLRTFIISGDKKIIPSCSIYYWLNAFPYLQKLKISRMKIIGSSSSTLYAPSYHRNSSSNGTYYHHLRGLVLKKSELRLENEGGLEGLLKRCLKVNTIELNQLKIATPSLWYQKGNYKSSIPFFIDASHLRLDHLVLMNITFYPLLTSSLSSSSSVANPFLNYHHDYSFYYWDTLLNQYKTYYTIEEMGSTKDIIHYPSHDQLENNNTFTINFYLKCQSIDQLEFY
ncbi:hypothetical protein BJ944DRAFT_263663 [Cunninghamella echinulata]|nr:hypothetical protein BJ944DRAFT_263663 [Cunninghamella echinulata]